MIPLYKEKELNLESLSLKEGFSFSNTNDFTSSIIKVGKLVVINIIIKNDTNIPKDSVTVFSLPPEFRPRKSILASCSLGLFEGWNSDGGGWCQITSYGGVNIRQHTNEVYNNINIHAVYFTK